jgi:hypothetical protein
MIFRRNSVRTRRHIRTEVSTRGGRRLQPPSVRWRRLAVTIRNQRDDPGFTDRRQRDHSSREMKGKCSSVNAQTSSRFT